MVGYCMPLDVNSVMQYISYVHVYTYVKGVYKRMIINHVVNDYETQ